MLDKQISLGYDKKSVVINISNPEEAKTRYYALVWGKDLYPKASNLNIEINSTKVTISGNDLEAICEFLILTADMDEASRQELLRKANEATFNQRTFKPESPNAAQPQQGFGQSSQVRQSTPTLA